MSFREYWQQNEAFYTSLGVSKDVAYKIWCDALDQLKIKYQEFVISKL